MSGLPQPIPSDAFDGETYRPKQDHKRLQGQLLKVFAIMADGRPRTLAEIQAEVFNKFKKHASEAAISARLRDLRKVKYGGHTVDRYRSEFRGGLYRYRLTVRRG